jgi:hypothetical protein
MLSYSRYLSIALILLASAVLLNAQETSGNISGTVIDPTGATVPGAKIEIAGTALVRPLETLTDNSGTFLFPKLPPGPYTITVSASGFRTVRETGVSVAVGRTSSVHIKLEVGGVTESVQIQATAIQVDTTASAATTSVTSEFFNRMPKSRSFDTLIQLAPGTRAEPKSGQYTIDGASGSENSWIIDGVERSSIQNGTLGASARIPYEFVQEIEVKSSGFEAQYPATTGGVINAVTRSGGNDFHGQLGMYVDNNVLRAEPRQTLRFSPLDSTQSTLEWFRNTRDPYRNLGPVAILGGRIIRDKLWFFAGWAPTFSRTTRTTSLADDPSKTMKEWETTSRRDYLQGKIDYAPISKLRTFVSYLYSPGKTNGSLPSQDGTSRSTTPFADLGSRSPAATYGWSATYTPMAKMVLSYHGGFNYTNSKSYGVPSNIYYQYLNSNLNITTLDIPANLRAASGNFTANTSQTVYDKNNREVHYVDADYLWGKHTFKAGYSINRLSNDVFTGYPNGRFNISWNNTYTAVTKPGTFRGPYGYYINYAAATTGKVSSNNQGFYFQDNWRVARRLTLNLGARFDREFVPSFRTDSGQAARAIEWGFGDKFTPRLGFAWDILGNAKWTLKGSYGRLFDQFKYNLPRGLFGGDFWTNYVYTLDDPDITKINLKNTPGTFIESVDNRITSNDPDDYRIDPNLQPVRKHFYNLLSDYQINSNMVLSVRYTRNRLDRTIEDVGLLTSRGESYFIANPGFGVVADASRFPAGIPTTPRAVMNYDALEIRIDKRFTRNLMYSVSYNYSRLWGNYSGLSSSDEGGRNSPNTDRNFDLPWEKYNGKGQPVYGLLATDRPHTFKLFGSYSLKSPVGSTSISPILSWFSGTPESTQLGVINLPILVNGRGDMGRSPVYYNLDLQLAHDIKVPHMKEGWRLRVQGDIFNATNTRIAFTRAVTYQHSITGNLQFNPNSDFFKGFDYKALMAAQNKRADPRYGLANSWNDERTVRLAIHFIF